MVENLGARVHCGKTAKGSIYTPHKKLYWETEEEIVIKTNNRSSVYQEDRRVMLKNKTDEKRCVTISDARKLGNYGGKLVCCG